MVIFIVLCMFLGIYLDNRLGTGYNFSLLMTIVGMGVGGWWTYRRIIKNSVKMDKEEEEDEEEENENRESTSAETEDSTGTEHFASHTSNNLNKTDGENGRNPEEE